MTPPDWLTQRGGSLKLGSDGRTWFVIFNARPEYSIVATPVAGIFAPTLRQTSNGVRLGSDETHASKEEAIRGGLEELRKALGWG
jgi:hypothetical protein